MIQVIFFVTRVVHLVVRILVSRQIPVTLHIGSSIVHIIFVDNALIASRRLFHSLATRSLVLNVSQEKEPAHDSFHVFKYVYKLTISFTFLLHFQIPCVFGVSCIEFSYSNLGRA